MYVWIYIFDKYLDVPSTARLTVDLAPISAMRSPETTAQIAFFLEFGTFKDFAGAGGENIIRGRSDRERPALAHTVSTAGCHLIGDTLKHCGKDQSQDHRYGSSDSFVQRPWSRPLLPFLTSSIVCKSVCRGGV